MMRNPSPPPLTNEEREQITADYIGDTLFSKRFVLSTLLKLYKHAKKEIYLQEKPIDDNDDGDDDDNDDFENQNHHHPHHDFGNVLELQEKIEEELCELWDMTANQDVGLFLCEHDGKDILLDALQKTLSPRLMEITFGILGNLSCIDSLCRDFSMDETFRSSVLSYLKITDALSLVELTRMLTVCLTNSQCQLLWVENFAHFFDDMVCILQNGLNIDLLENILTLVDIIFDIHEESVEQNATLAFINALKSCSTELIKHKRYNAIVMLVRLLQVISTTVNGVECLTQSDNLNDFLCEILTNEHLTHSIENEKREILYSSIFSILKCILNIHPLETLLTLNKHELALQVLYDCLQGKIEHYKTLVSDDDNAREQLCSAQTSKQENINSKDAGDDISIDIHFITYIEFLHELCLVINKSEPAEINNFLKCFKRYDYGKLLYFGDFDKKEGFFKLFNEDIIKRLREIRYNLQKFITLCER